MATERGHARLRWLLLLGAGTVALAAIAALGLAAGRPHVAWKVNFASNTLTIGLSGGQGPFAGWLQGQSSIRAQFEAGRTVTLPLTPGRTNEVSVTLESLWSSSDRVRVTLPPQPEETGTRVDGDAMTVSFSTPVQARNAPCGLKGETAWTQTFAFPRQKAECSDMLEVAAVSGERAVVGVTVPALPPPPPPAPPPPPPPAVPREIFTGPPGGGAYYITIDDGWFPNNDVLALMQQQHIPITTFLLSDAAAAHLDFWKSFLAAGGEIEDHTINHPDLTKLSAAAAQAQWQGGADRLHALLGVSPVLGRPPYGAANAAVVGAAGHAGLHGVVMWSATMNGGHLATNDGKPLHAGSIVLMHWTSDVWLNLQTVLAMGNAAGLHPALLGPALQQTGY